MRGRWRRERFRARARAGAWLTGDKGEGEGQGKGEGEWLTGDKGEGEGEGEGKGEGEWLTSDEDLRESIALSETCERGTVLIANVSLGVLEGVDVDDLVGVGAGVRVVVEAKAWKVRPTSYSTPSAFSSLKAVQQNSQFCSDHTTMGATPHVRRTKRSASSVTGGSSMRGGGVDGVDALSAISSPVMSAGTCRRSGANAGRSRCGTGGAGVEGSRRGVVTSSESGADDVTT